MSFSTANAKQHPQIVVPQKLFLNLLHFSHPASEFTFWFTDAVSDGLCRVHKNLVPDEVKQYFGRQEHYFTSFDREQKGFFPVTKKTIPVHNGEKIKIRPGSAFSLSLLRRYYNLRIVNWFRDRNQLVKPDFADDVEIWLNTHARNAQYWIFEKYKLKLQFAKITDKPELIISYAGQSKIFRQSVAALMPLVSPICFKGVVHNRKLYRYNDLPEEMKQNLQKVYPVWNFRLRDALCQEIEAPDKSNKYIRFKDKINRFFTEWINTPAFKSVLPVISTAFESVPQKNISKVNENSNLMVFGNHKQDVAPYSGMKNGPFKSAEYTKIQFFYIFHKGDRKVTFKLDEYFREGLNSFKGLYNFTRVPYYTQPGFSITFSDKANPLPEIEAEIHNRSFNSELHYMAIYVSPHSKTTRDRQCKQIYYRVKELMLKKGIASQAVDADKIRSAIVRNERIDYILNNIAIAILAKLDGIPWQLKTLPVKELIVGVGAFKSKDTKMQYLGSAVCFSNNGKFNQFECFRKDQTDELAGLIIWQIKQFITENKNISRLIIHFYKNMCKKELEPIEEGLHSLGLHIPVYVVSINKTESHDITVFDDNWPGLMPLSGTIIKIDFNRYLLFNNTRYKVNGFNKNDGYPFPIKLSIACIGEEPATDTISVMTLIDQVYQFSRMYWKSVRQQNLPVTIKYPELIAEIFPHFVCRNIPDFGKNNLWFL